MRPQRPEWHLFFLALAVFFAGLALMIEAFAGGLR